MSKMVRLNEDVYFALKARASKEGRTLSATVYALMHTADEHPSTQKQLISLESQIKELKSDLFLKEDCYNVHKENKRPRARFEPASWPPQGHRITRLPHLGKYLTDDSPVRIRTAVAGFLLSVVNVQDHVNPKARMIDHYTTGLLPRVRVKNT
jgi:hypothetical protein